MTPISNKPTTAGPQRVLRTRDAATYLGVAASTLEKFRLTGGGPRFIRLGRRAVGYDVNDLIEWLEVRKVRSTSEGDGKTKGAGVTRRPRCSSHPLCGETSTPRTETQR